MKKIAFTFILFALCANVSAQLKINSSGQVVMGTSLQNYKLEVAGNTYAAGNILLGWNASNFLGTTGNFPITFRVNNTLAGFTGHSGVDSNVSFGYGALYPISLGFTSGGFNVAIGLKALYSNGDNYHNTAVGAYALYNNEGDSNTANGSYALNNSTWGSFNTANGANALLFNTTGSNNTANGFHALYSNVTGYNNTAIGCYANVGGTNLTNATAIGYNAKVNASNTIVLGNSSVTSVCVHTSSIYSSSDGRAKKNIRAEVPGLAFINQLKPVVYNYDLDALDELQKSDDPKINAFNDSLRNARSQKEKSIDAKAREDKEKIVYSGFIAQDVEKAARSIGYDFSGIDVPKNGKGAYGLGYSEFVVPLVKAVQELSEQNARLQAQIDELKGNAPSRTVPNEPEITEAVDAVVAQCKLYQNTPNPFNQDTEIKFFISKNVKTAQLCIYNLQGTQIKQISIAQRGEGSQRISGSELVAGIYLYALIVDGKEVDTKKMILTK